MGDDTAKTPISREDYEAIEAAVMETARGRWFMAEFARRNRHADTERLLASLDRIERAVSIRDAGGRLEDPTGIGLQRDLADMADRIATTKRDIAKSVADATGSHGSVSAETALEDLVTISEQADTEAFDAAEQIQEIAWSLRETTENPEVIGALEDLDRHALDVYRATNRHALTTVRVRSLIGVLRSIESRIQGMLGASPAAEPTPPRAARTGPAQQALPSPSENERPSPSAARPTTSSSLRRTGPSTMVAPCWRPRWPLPRKRTGGSPGSPRCRLRGHRCPGAGTEARFVRLKSSHANAGMRARTMKFCRSPPNVVLRRRP